MNMSAPSVPARAILIMDNLEKKVAYGELKRFREPP